MKSIFIILLLFAMLFASCISTKNTIKNIDNNAPSPTLVNGNHFKLTKISTNKNYGFNPNYPVNVYFLNTKNDTLNCVRFLKAISGPHGEEILFKRIESCCPFPSKQSKIGAGFLEVYEVYWSQNDIKKIYFNIYEKGILEAPYGFTIK